jgi:hypothetical protein
VASPDLHMLRGLDRSQSSYAARRLLTVSVEGAGEVYWNSLCSWPHQCIYSVVSLSHNPDSITGCPHWRGICSRCNEASLIIYKRILYAAFLLQLFLPWRSCLVRDCGHHRCQRHASEGTVLSREWTRGAKCISHDLCITTLE